MAMNEKDLERAFKKGRISSDQTGNAQMGLHTAPICVGGDQEALISDLIDQLIEMRDQLQLSHAEGANKVVVIQLSGAVFRVRTVGVEVPGPTFSASNANSEFPGLSSKEGTASATADAIRVQGGNMAAALADKCNSELNASNSEGNAIDSDDDIAAAKNEIGSSKDNSSGGVDPSRNGINFDESKSPELFPIWNAENEMKATLIAQKILRKHADGEINDYESIQAEIEKSPLPEHTRKLVVCVKSSWKAYVNENGVVDWTGLRGIDYPVPMARSLGIKAATMSVDKSSHKTKLEVLGLYEGDPNIHRLIKAKLRPKTQMISSAVATQEFESRLSRGMADALLVDVTLCISRHLAKEKAIQLRVIDAHCVQPTTEEERERTRRTMDAAFVAARQQELWPLNSNM